MKSIYLLSAPGGMYINFLCSQISRDENYGSFPPTVNLARYNEYATRHTAFHRYIKDNSTGLTFPVLSQEFKNDLYSYIQEKNIALHSHYYKNDPIDLNYLKKVKFIVSEESFLMVYLMFLAKVCTRSVVLDQSLISQLSTTHISAANIIPDQTVNYLALLAFEANMSIQDYVISMHTKLMEISVGMEHDRLPGWDHLNPHDLFFGTDSSIATAIGNWQEYFDMAQPFDINELRSYHNANLQLIQDKFNMTYNNISVNGWQAAGIQFAENNNMPIQFAH